MNDDIIMNFLVIFAELLKRASVDNRSLRGRADCGQCEHAITWLVHIIKVGVVVVVLGILKVIGLWAFRVEVLP